MNLQRPLRMLAVMVLLTLAFVATGFAHRMPSADDLAQQSYVLAGGDLSGLCGDADGDGLPDHIDCPACHLTGNAPPPAAPPALQDAAPRLLATVTAPRESHALRMVRDPARGLRAPPLV